MLLRVIYTAVGTDLRLRACQFPFYTHTQWAPAVQENQYDVEENRLRLAPTLNKVV